MSGVDQEEDFSAKNDWRSSRHPDTLCNVTHCCHIENLATRLDPDIEGLEKTADDKITFPYAEGRKVDCHAVYYFLGGTTPTAYLEKTGLALIDGKPKLVPWRQTETPGLFLAGGLAVEKGSIMAAFNSGAQAVQGIRAIITEGKR